MSRLPHSAPMRRQRGVALLTALLIVSIASITAVAMTEALQLSVRRTSNIQLSDQRHLLNLGSVAWARGQLIRDQINSEGGDDYDALNEDWAKPLPVTQIEGGKISARISDLQGRFNLNNLSLPKQAGDAEKQRFTRNLELFKSLLNLLEVDEGIAQATADWIDADLDIRFPDGAEDNEYLNLPQPYRTANAPMASSSELRLVKGVTAEVYEKIAPFITVLPEPTAININTTSATLLRALVTGLDKGAAESLLSDRKENPIKNKTGIEDRLKEILGDNNDLLEKVNALTDVKSRYYLLETSVELDMTTQKLQSVLYKGGKDISILSRTLEPY